MVLNKALSLACEQLQPLRLRTLRPPILVLENANDGNASPPVATEIGSTWTRAVSPEVRTSTAVGTFQSRGEAAITAWRRLQSQFDGICVGLVAEQGSGIAGAAEILQECLPGGTAPGAIVLLGFSQDFVATCLRLAGHAAEASAEGPASPVSADWPPMVIFLPADDPSIGDCAVACRLMRSAGISIRLEVMRSTLDAAPETPIKATGDELADELERFFTEYLTPAFPKLL